MFQLRVHAAWCHTIRSFVEKCANRRWCAWRPIPRATLFAPRQQNCRLSRQTRSGCGERSTVTPSYPVDMTPSLPINFTPNDSSGKPLLKLTRRSTLNAGCSSDFRIVQHGEHDIGHIAVFPIARAAGGVNACRPQRAGDGVKAGEQMHEQIAGDTGAVIAKVAPAEEARRVPFAFGRVAQELLPIASGQRLASVGMEYSQAPMAVLRSSHASTEFNLPMAFC